MVVEPSLQDESEFLYAAQPELLSFKTTQLAVERVMHWFQSRAEEIEHHAGQVRAAAAAVRGLSVRSGCQQGCQGPVRSLRGSNEHFLPLLFICLESFYGFLEIIKEQTYVRKVVQNLS